jgi:ribosomal protein S27AE
MMFSEDKPTIECPRCKSLLANDDPALEGKRVECPKCGESVTLPRISSVEGWSEKQLLAEIRGELVKSNRMLSLIWILAILHLIGIAMYIFIAVFAAAR